MKVVDCFYEKGLTFSCLPGCRYCCSVEPGFVFLSLDDISRLTEKTDTSLSDFIERYCVIVPMGDVKHISLKETPQNDCIFLTEKGCGVYDARPVQCSTYPFWSHVLESRKTWDEEKQWCPGINQGELNTKEYIEEQLILRVRNQPVTLEEIQKIMDIKQCR